MGTDSTVTMKTPNIEHSSSNPQRSQSDSLEKIAKTITRKGCTEMHIYSTHILRSWAYALFCPEVRQLW